MLLLYSLHEAGEWRILPDPKALLAFIFGLLGNNPTLGGVRKGRVIIEVASAILYLW